MGISFRKLKVVLRWKNWFINGKLCRFIRNILKCNENSKNFVWMFEKMQM